MQEVADALRLDTELSADSAAYIEELYEQYLTSPESVGEDWRVYFDKFPKVINLIAMYVSNSFYWVATQIVFSLWLKAR